MSTVAAPRSGGSAVVARPRVLCVDDEPQVLEGLGLHLRRSYEVSTACGGAQALELLAGDSTVAVIISDMRMPGMDGATFLARARGVAPNATRLLLTGQSDLDSAIAAVNDGQIFRFLTKPCPPPTLLAAVSAAAEQHRLITAERLLLEQTLMGSVRTLIDVLALARPSAFGRATQVKELVRALAMKLGMQEVWQVEMAASLSQLGAVALPEDVVEKVNAGQALTPEEERMVGRAPALTEQLLGHIPRLEGVRGILAEWSRPGQRRVGAAEAEREAISAGAAVLRIAVDFDALERQGMEPALALDTLRGRSGKYDERVLGALQELRGGGRAARQIKEASAGELRVGMVFAEDVKTRAGVLLVVRGYEVTQSFLERIRNHPGNLQEPLRVIVRAAPSESAAR